MELQGLLADTCMWWGPRLVARAGPTTDSLAAAGAQSTGMCNCGGWLSPGMCGSRGWGKGLG